MKARQDLTQDRLGYRRFVRAKRQAFENLMHLGGRVLHQVPYGIIPNFHGQGLLVQAASATLGTDPMFIFIRISDHTQSVAHRARPVFAIKRKKPGIQGVHALTAGWADAPQAKDLFTPITVYDQKGTAAFF